MKPKRRHTRTECPLPKAPTLAELAYQMCRQFKDHPFAGFNFEVTCDGNEYRLELRRVSAVVGRKKGKTK